MDWNRNAMTAASKRRSSARHSLPVRPNVKDSILSGRMTVK
jgi:hypothetical protein